MTGLPEQYLHYLQPGPQPVRAAQVELYDDRDPVVWIPGAYGDMVPVRKSQAPAAMQAPPVRDLSPRPLFDPFAQRLLAGGLGAGAAGAGLGFGLGQLAAGLALMGSSGLAVLVGLLLAARLRGGSTYVRQEVHNHARWFGKSYTNL